ncbi:MAG: acyl-CoA dehydrogenase family protein [Pseudomonadales bacterium]|nr:acyl-CoA dehydrogenase family protein [Pseudomonadales bacterium]MCP5182520.1 acyl-CoA dehydrogenase family protein [Pseudomonadales bacterium]
MTNSDTAFRNEVSAWLEANCPVSMRTRMVPEEAVNGGNRRRGTNADAYLWLDRMAARGWTAPTWPRVYGGAGLDKDAYVILMAELQRLGARPPLGGMGITMLGPTLLEFGTDAQKARHLPPIARGETAWCQGYSEPGAGSDLASLATHAEDRGDHFLVNGAKIWTSGAQHADWMFCLVRTDRAAPKHRGISFLLIDMTTPGVTVRPIRMINGASPFCQTFFDNVVVPRDNLVGALNDGWTVGKRLLQHERSGLAALASADTAGPMDRIRPALPMPELARQYGNAGIEPELRQDLIDNAMLRAALLLTQRRTLEESAAHTPGAATSIFKYVEANYVKEQLELQLRIRGTAGLGWSGDDFDADALDKCRLWLEAKSISIAGGSNEIQLNIIARRVLGLPD